MVVPLAKHNSFITGSNVFHLKNIKSSEKMNQSGKVKLVHLYVGKWIFGIHFPVESCCYRKIQEHRFLEIDQPEKKQELPIEDMFVNASGQYKQSI